MSMPNIPDINPEISLCRQEVINLLLSSIAMEELSLSHIINAEGKKMQAFLEKSEFCNHPNDLIAINESIHKTLEGIEKIENLLVNKLKSIIEIIKINPYA